MSFSKRTISNMNIATSSPLTVEDAIPSDSPKERRASLGTTQANIANLLEILASDNVHDPDFDRSAGMEHRVSNLIGRFRNNITGMQTEFQGILQSFRRGQLSPLDMQSFLDAEEKRGLFTLELASNLKNFLENIFSGLNEIMVNIKVGRTRNAKEKIDDIFHTLDLAMNSVVNISRIAAASPDNLVQSIQVAETESRKLASHLDMGHFSQLLARLSEEGSLKKRISTISDKNDDFSPAVESTRQAQVIDRQLRAQTSLAAEGDENDANSTESMSVNSETLRMQRESLNITEPKKVEGRVHTSSITYNVESAYRSRAPHYSKLKHHQKDPRVDDSNATRQDSTVAGSMLPSFETPDRDRGWRPRRVPTVDVACQAKSRIPVLETSRTIRFHYSGTPQPTKRKSKDFSAEDKMKTAAAVVSKFSGSGNIGIKKKVVKRRKGSKGGGSSSDENEIEEGEERNKQALTPWDETSALSNPHSVHLTEAITFAKEQRNETRATDGKKKATSLRRRDVSVRGAAVGAGGQGQVSAENSPNPVISGRVPHDLSPTLPPSRRGSQQIIDKLLVGMEQLKGKEEVEGEEEAEALANSIANFQKAEQQLLRDRDKVSNCLFHTSHDSPPPSSVLHKAAGEELFFAFTLADYNCS